MEKDLSHYRKSYERNPLLRDNLPENPMELFQLWFHEADDTEGIEEANVMSLSTLGLDGFPKTRIVLLKRFTWEGFVFFSNYKSEKGQAIEKDPRVSLNFFWHSLERQIVIKGRAEKLVDNLSDGYFETRPDGSKLGAWASDQSQPLTSRGKLVAEVATVTAKYVNSPPRPPFWGGFRIAPVEIEFWADGPFRLHDRFRWTRSSTKAPWSNLRLYP